MDKPTTVLVTGASGAVGSRLVPRLRSRGWAVRVLVRDPERAEPFRAAGDEVVIGDLRDDAVAATAVAGAGAVVNLAAAFGRGVADEEAEAVNHRAAAGLATAARDAGVRRHVLVSTNLVYGPGRGRPARETDPPHPDHAYPASKQRAEAAVTGVPGLDVRVLRLAFVYGDGDPHLPDLVPRLRAWPAHQRLHPVHHADVAQAVWRALVLDGAAGRVYNVADDAPVSAAELLMLYGEEPDPEVAQHPLADPWAGIVDTARVRRELGFRPVYPTVHTARDAGAL